MDSEPTIQEGPAPANGLNEQAVRAKTGELSRNELASLIRANQRKRWQQGDRVHAESFLAEFPSLKADELVVLDLLMDEVQLREQAGEKPDIEEYCQRFPDLAIKLRRQFALHQMLDSSFSVHSPALKESADTDSFGPRRTINPVPDPGRPTVEGYELLSELGRGGMGVVYKARQLKLGRLVALKMILAGAHAGKEDLLRFRTEAEAVASIQHPNIVQIYEVGEQGGWPYFSLEFVEGGSLSDKLDEGKILRPEEAARMIETLARAVHAAHEKGIIHRDLKPGNVLLTTDGVPKVTDFGLAKRLDSEKGQTRSGSVMGTPSYMAPEQASGNTREVGTLSDVYALGAILYELLTGRPPFLAESPLDTMLQVVNDEPVPPRRLQPKVPVDLETICLKCLEKQPRRRYSSAHELAEDLRHYLNDEPIVARPIGKVERVVKWAMRRPATAALLAVCLLGLLGLIAGGTWYHVRLENALAESERNHLEAAQRLVRLTVSNGIQLTENGDLLGSLPWFARALELVDKDPERREMHRIRMGSILRQCPKIEEMWFHDGRVTAASYSNDGRRVLTASADGTARIWDPATGKPVGRPLKHDDVINDAAFSDDGKRVVTASADGSARVWDTETGKPLTRPLRHDKGVVHAEFSPDGKRVLTASQDNTAQVWDASTGEKSFTLEHKGPVRWATFSRNGHRIVTASDDDTAQVWDASQGTPLGKPMSHGEDVLHAEFSPDGSRVVTASSDGTGRVWDAATGKEVSPPLKHEGPVDWAVFSPDGKLVATTSEDNSARLWDATTGALASAPMKHDSNVYYAHFSPDGKNLVTASDDNTARVWEVATGKPLSVPLRHNATVYRASFSHDGHQVLTGSADGTARIWKATVNDVLGPPLKHGSRVTSASFSPDGKLVATTSRNGNTTLWEAATGKRLAPVLRHNGPVYSAEFSPGGRRIVTASADRTARIWDTATGKAVVPPLEHLDEVRYASFSPDGKRVVTAGADHRGVVWDAATGEEISHFKDHTASLNWARFSPDGKKVVTASVDHTARIWDAASGEAIAPPLKHREEVFTAEFSPDGRNVVTASADRTARVWNAADGTGLVPAMHHSSKIYQANFSPDSKRVVTGSDDNTARVWDAATGQPLTPLMRHGGTVFRAKFGPEGRRIATASEDNTGRVWDASTGAPLTPPLPHSAGVVDISFSPHAGRVVTASNDRTARVWTLPPDERPLEELVLLSKFLAGGWIDATGGFMPLEPDQMKQMYEKYRDLQKNPKKTR